MLKEGGKPKWLESKFAFVCTSGSLEFPPGMNKVCMYLYFYLCRTFFKKPWCNLAMQVVQV